MGPDDLTALLAGPAVVVPQEGLRERLERVRPLRVKLGLDPTAPAVTLGWAVVLRKLRQFQDAGHIAVLIVGDFTARVGDPSGTSETRPRLSKEEVDAYADRLLDQFWMILDRDRTEVRHNSEWLEGLDIEGVLRLTASYTVARMLERDDFAKRYEDGRPISIMEFLYPLMQGYDSVAVRADVELGGNDQLFNLLVGRDLQREYGQEPQVALTVPLLVGTDGVQKMSQSLGNYVGITDEPADMFGRLARIPDELIPIYRRLTLDAFDDPAEADRVAAALRDGSTDPWSEKRRLAREVVALYHGQDAGERAEAEFDRVHKQGEQPTEVPSVTVRRDAVLVRKRGGATVVDRAGLLKELGLTGSKAAARRAFEQAGVRCDGERIDDPEQPLEEPGPQAEEALNALVGSVWQVGRRRFARVAGFF